MSTELITLSSSQKDWNTKGEGKASFSEYRNNNKKRFGHIYCGLMRSCSPVEDFWLLFPLWDVRRNVGKEITGHCSMVEVGRNLWQSPSPASLQSRITYSGLHPHSIEVYIHWPSATSCTVPGGVQGLSDPLPTVLTVGDHRVKGAVHAVLHYGGPKCLGWFKVKKIRR